MAASDCRGEPRRGSCRSGMMATMEQKQEQSSSRFGKVLRKGGHERSVPLDFCKPGEELRGSAKAGETVPHLGGDQKHRPPPTCTASVRVRVIEGRQLQGNNLKPVVKVFIGEHMNRTRIRRGNNPFFNEIFFQNFHQSPALLFDETIHLQVLNSQSLRADSMIGMFKMEIGNVYNAPGHVLLRKWLTLHDPDYLSSGIRGYLKVSLYVLGVGDRAPMEEPPASESDDVESNLLMPAAMPVRMATIMIRVYRAEDIPHSYDHLDILEGMYGNTVDKEDCFVHFETTMQKPGEKLSKFAAHLVKAVRKEAITAQDMDRDMDESFSDYFKHIFQMHVSRKSYVDPFVELSFAGTVLKTKVIQMSKDPEWNQLLCFPVQFPSMCDKIKLTIFDWNRTVNEAVGTTFISLSQISSTGAEIEGDFSGFLPCFGPSFLNLYGSPREFTGVQDPYSRLNYEVGEGIAYRGRVLLELATNMEEIQKPNNQLEPISYDENLVILERFLYRRKFCLCGVFYSASMLPSITDLVQFEVSMGNYGNKFDVTCKPLSSTTQYSQAVFDGNFYYYLPWYDTKPVVALSCFWEDVTNRIDALNIMQATHDKLKQNLHALKCMRGPEDPSLMSTWKSCCRTCWNTASEYKASTALRVQPLPPLGQAATVLDEQLQILRSFLLQEIARSAEKLQTETSCPLTLIPEVEDWLQRIASVTREPQASLPDVVIWMLCKEKRLAYARVKAHTIMFSNTSQDACGKLCGKTQTIFLTYLQSKKNETCSPIQLRMRLWLGLASDRMKLNNYWEGKLFVYAETVKVTISSMPQAQQAVAAPVLLLQYENQVKIFGKWCSKGLAQHPNFSDITGKLSLPKDKFQLPKGWRWDGDWVVEPQKRLLLDGDTNHSEVLEQVYENEIREPGEEWGPAPVPHTNADGTACPQKEAILCPPDWYYRDDWKVEVNRAVDEAGWEYGVGFDPSTAPRSWHTSEKTYHTYRRRRWGVQLDDLENEKIKEADKKQQACDILQLNTPIINCIHQRPIFYQLCCYIYQARHLLPAHHRTFANPYAHVAFLYKSQRTEVLSATLHPIWDQTLLFHDVLIYGDPQALLQDSPFVTVELFNKTSIGKDEFLGRCLCQPVVYLDLSARVIPQLQLYPIRRQERSAGDLSAAFELLLDNKEGGLPELLIPPEKMNKTFMIPKEIRPTLKLMTVEILAWGLRGMKSYNLLSLMSPSLVVECGDRSVQTAQIRSLKKNPNFPSCLYILSVYLPKENTYHPPIILKVLDNRPFGYKPVVGQTSIWNLSQYYCNPFSKGAVPKLPIRVASLTDTPTVMEKEVQESQTLMEKKKEEEDVDIDWWNKFYVSVGEQSNTENYLAMGFDTLKIYDCELEEVPQFQGLQDFCQTFKLRQGQEEDDEDDPFVVGEVKGVQLDDLENEKIKEADKKQQACDILQLNTPIINCIHQHPYAHVAFLYKSQRTEVLSATLHPIWDQTLLFHDVLIYGDPQALLQDSPFVTVELFNKTSIGKDEFLGRCLCQPVVYLDLSARVIPQLQLYPIRRQERSAGDLSAAFELLLDNKEGGLPELLIPPEKMNKTFMIPKEIRPTLKLMTVEILAWGLRGMKSYNLLSLMSPSLVVECGDRSVQTAQIRSLKKNPNFPSCLYILSVYLPKENTYHPPIILKVLDNRPFGYKPVVGQTSIWNLSQYYCNPFSKGAVPKLPIRVASLTDTPTVMEKEVQESQTLMEKKKEEEDVDIDWWNKFYVSVGEQSNTENYLAMGFDTLKIYDCELEEVPQFQGLQDFCQTFKLRQGQEEDDEDDPFVVGEVKCSFRIYPISEDPDVPRPPRQFKELPESAPQECLIRVYIIRGLNLQPRDRNGMCDPYVRVAVGKNVIDDREHYQPVTLDPVFGMMFEMSCIIPQEKDLKVSLYDFDLLSPDEKIGETVIDLENRLLSQFGANCGLPQTYCISGPNVWRDQLTPIQLLEHFAKLKNWTVPQFNADGKIAVVKDREILLSDFEQQVPSHGHLGPAKQRLALHLLRIQGQVPEHVETRTLYNALRPRMDQGKIQMWVDIFPKSLGPPGPPYSISPRIPKKYELRCIVWNTMDVDLQETSLSGEKMSDIYVKGWLEGLEEDKQRTEIHYRSLGGEGNFNWRFVFSFDYLPMEQLCVLMKKEHIWSLDKKVTKIQPKLVIQIWDNDKFSFDDFLGFLELNLVQLPLPKQNAKECTLEMVVNQEGTAEETPSRFISLFKERILKGWWPCIVMENNKYRISGKIQMTLEIVMEKEIEERPAGKGREEPNMNPKLDAPIRPETSLLWFKSPLASFKYIFWRPYKWRIIGFSSILLLILFVGVFIYSFPGYLSMKLLKPFEQRIYPSSEPDLDHAGLAGNKTSNSSGGNHTILQSLKKHHL
ncbi:fer-1-like protein 5 [Rhinatrema bivittatum]|uniref:fer-1-like protein 5 n=1 Tax=Rhinatrema bivittatum TaxID=194408 RepID=UPI00112BEB79|nr:fer-1-like protein 5 [Rhinatrema bivittatum]